MPQLFSLKIRTLWQTFKAQHFVFWSVCVYLFFEYVRPQSIYTSIDVLPWAQLALISTLLGILAEKNRPKVGTTIGNLMILYFFVILISSVLAYDPSFSFLHLKDYYIWMITYFIIVYSVTSFQRLYLFICLFILCSFKLSLFGAKTWTSRGFSFTDWGLMGPPGHFQNSGEFAIQMTILFAVSYYFILSIQPYVTRRTKMILYLVPITAIMSVLGASSRGAQLALAVQVLFIFKWQKFSFKYIFFGLFAVLIAYQYLPEEQKARFSEAGDDKTSVQRLLYWEKGLDMIAENPVFGIGFYNFMPYYSDTYRLRAQLPHNIFIQVGTDVGLLGLLIHIITIWAGFSMNKRLRKRCDLTNQSHVFYYNVSRGVDLATIGYLVAGQFVTVTYYPFLWVDLAFATALTTAFNRDYKINQIKVDSV